MSTPQSVVPQEGAARFTEATRSAGPEALAIIGMACRFPGAARGLDEFWSLLARGGDAIREVPPDRWSARSYYAPLPPRPGYTYSRWGGFLDGIDRFDAGFFGIPPREAAAMDPQQRLMLEVAWEALDSAGLAREGLAGRPVGVFVGASATDYARLQWTSTRDDGLSPYTNAGGSLSIIGNRLSYVLDLRGPSLTIDTACSSSLVAFHFACESLRRGECEVALVGGVNLLVDPGTFVGFSQAHMLSPNGRCQSFSARADGYSRSEGAGVVILKPLSRAVADGDRIEAVVLATGVNQDGRTAGMSLPSEDAQAALLGEVYARAGVEPAQVGYVEAHGTGTPAGDPIEARALGRTLGQGRSPDRPLRIGSVKSNIGHLEPASGIAGVIKTVLALQHREIPASLNAEPLNPAIDFAALGLRVVTSAEAWDGTAVRVAGVNSFGFGGTNAHAVLAEAAVARPHSRPRPAGAEARSGRTSLVTISAATDAALRELAGSWTSWLAGPGRAVPLDDLAWTAATRRSHLSHRLAVAARDTAELSTLLDGWRRGEKRREVSEGRASRDGRTIAFVFNGMGSQWPEMGRELFRTEAAFRQTVETIDRAFRETAGWSLVAEIEREPSRSRIHEAEVAQPAIFAVQVGLAALWKHWGVSPDFIVGHSVGEAAAAHVAGLLSLDEAVTLVYHRSRLQQRLRGHGRMLAVGLSPEVVETYLDAYDGLISLAAVNGPNSVTLSGNADVLDELSRAFETSQTFCRFLQVDVPYHSPAMDAICGELRASLNGIGGRTGSIPFFSTVTGGRLEPADLNGEYWCRNVRQPVLFAAAMKALLDAGVNLAIEIGAHPVLGNSIRECAGAAADSLAVVPSLRRGEPQREFLLGSVGRVYALGVPVRWEGIFEERREVVSLPQYPWQREPYWTEVRDRRFERLCLSSAGISDLAGPAVSSLLGSPVRTAHQQRSWVVRLSIVGEHAWLSDHRVQGVPVFPGAGYVELALGAGRAQHPDQPLCLERAEIVRPLVLSETATTFVETVLDPISGQVSIISRDSEGNSTLHASARVRPFQPATGPSPVDDLEATRRRCSRSVPRSSLYDRFAELGLDYGPMFQGVDSVCVGEGEVWGEVRAPQGLLETEDFALCPTTFDAALQVLLAGMLSVAQAFVPVRISRIRLLDPSGTALRAGAVVVATLREQSPARLVADAILCDAGGRRIAEFDGIEVVPLPSARSGGRGDDRLWEHRWELRPRDGEPFSLGMPEPSELLPAAGEAPRPAAPDRDLERVSIAYFLQALRQMGAPLEAGGVLNADDLVGQCGIVEPCRRLAGAMLASLVRSGIAESVPEGVRLLDVPADDPIALWRDLVRTRPDLGSLLPPLLRAGSCLPGVLRGEMPPGQVFGPDELAALRDETLEFRGGHWTARGVLSSLMARLPPERPVRILEISPTGSLTPLLASVLPAERTDYVLAQRPGQTLELRAREFPFVRPAALDLGADLREQGHPEHGYDAIVAANVLHLAPDVRSALRRLLPVLAPNGLLLVLEPTRPGAFLDLTLGLFPEWWGFEDAELRHDSPLLPAETWKTLLEQEGCGAVSLHTPDRQGATLLLARPSDPPSQARAAGASSRMPSPGTWWILADVGSVADRVRSLVQAHGGRPVMIRPSAQFSDRPDDYGIRLHVADDFRRFCETARHRGLSPDAIVDLAGLDAPIGDDALLADLREAQLAGAVGAIHLLQAASEAPWTPPPRAWFVTRSVQPVGLRPGEPLCVAAAPMWGLARVAQNEFASFRCSTIDLSPQPGEAEIDSLVREIAAGSAETEIVLRGRDRYVTRLVKAGSRLRADVAATSYGVSFEQGILDSIALRPRPRQVPGPGEVEIEVEVAALNFKDVAKVLHMLSESTLQGTWSGKLLGIECSGRVAALGPGVEGFALGDRVLALAPGCLGRHAVTRADFVYPLPEHLSFEAAAGIAVVFLTAMMTLDLARTRPSDRVLIHSGAGGVGLAAIQQAAAAGLQCLATAGSPLKREFLHALGVKHVFDSRSLSFADEVLRVTGGEGVDMVLNSLAGPAIGAGLSVLAPGGRFVEIGKRDIQENVLMGLKPFDHNLAYIAFDLDRLMHTRPLTISRQLRELVARFARHELQPLPYRAFPVSRAADAFRHITKARQIGKIVLTMEDAPALEPPVDRRTPAFDPRATYLVTGGLSGFGLETARWLVVHGARHLALLSRRGASTLEAQLDVLELEAAGAKVLPLACDVADETHLAAALESIRQAMPPLKGVFHAAMVLDDALIPQLTASRMETVLAPKAWGAWNLHRLTRQDPLDYFVLYSSATTVIGNLGQANYVAACTFLDQLAAHRRNLGLPGLSVGWGPVEDVGYLARNAEVHRHLTERIGFDAIPSGLLLEALGNVLDRPLGQIAVMQCDWSRVSPAVFAIAGTPRLAPLLEHHSRPGESGAAGRIRETILTRPPEERTAALKAWLVDVLAAVFGTSPSQVETDQSLLGLGMDSLMAVELQQRVSKELGCEIPSMRLMSGPSIDELVKELFASLDGSAGSPSPDAQAATAVTEVPAQPADTAAPLIV